MATAASVEGATEPTASPSDADVKDSNVRMPRNEANLRQNMLFDRQPAEARKLRSYRNTMLQPSVRGLLMSQSQSHTGDADRRPIPKFDSSATQGAYRDAAAHASPAHRLALALRPVMGYTRLPNSSGNSAPTGNSAINLRYMQLCKPKHHAQVLHAV